MNDPRPPTPHAPPNRGPASPFHTPNHRSTDFPPGSPPTPEAPVNVTAPDHVRRQLLDTFEANRRARDRGCYERQRYAPMQCRPVGVAGLDRLVVEVSGEEWAGAARPSVGAFSLADPCVTVRVFDAQPTIAMSNGAFGSREWRVDDSAPVRLIVGWHGATRVELDRETVWPLSLSSGSTVAAVASEQIVHDVRFTWEAGPVTVAFAGRTFEAQIAPWRRPRPPCPLLSMSDREMRDARGAARSKATAGLIGSDWSRAWSAAEAEIDRALDAERRSLATWESQERGRTPVALNINLLDARWPDGFVLTDDC